MLGISFQGYIKAIDHWIALILLSILCGKMIYEFYESRKEVTDTANASIDKANAVSMIVISCNMLFWFLQKYIHYSYYLSANPFCDATFNFFKFLIHSSLTFTSPTAKGYSPGNDATTEQEAMVAKITR